jgi:hypothetical protein
MSSTFFFHLRLSPTYCILRRMTTDQQTLRTWQRQFEEALPRINKVISFRLRHLRGEKKEEESAEALALTWQYYLRKRERGDDPMPFITKIAEYGARHVNRGGRLAGHQTTKDAMSRVAKHRTGHSVQTIHPKEDGEMAPEVLSALTNRGASPADQAALNIDFQEFLDELDQIDPRYRPVALQLASGMTGDEVGREHRLSRGRISQFRGKFRERCKMLTERER